MNISELCTPSMIYFVLSFLTLVIRMFTSFDLMSLLSKGVFIFLWSWFLNFLCTKGYGIVSWILIILPFFVM
jgi:hypothetical protein